MRITAVGDRGGDVDWFASFYLPYLVNMFIVHVALPSQDLIDILKHLVVIQEDEVEGKMYVLKGRHL
jgi:hypothetical protein